MTIKLKLSSQIILEKKFQGSTPGYNPLQVDEFIDKIIKDYKVVEGNALVYKSEIDELNKQIETLTKENKELSLANLKYESRLSNIKENDNVTSENVDLIKRINVLEKYLYYK